MNMQPIFKKWARTSLFSLALVSFLGVILRYKIAFSLPIVDQKHLLHGHSHFAFTGWVSQMIMAIMTVVFSREQGNDFFRNKKVKTLLILNLAAAYGMLLSFIWQGYGPVSVSFSFISILTGYLFAGFIWKQTGKGGTSGISGSYFRAAAVFNIISSFGTFWLAYMMFNKVFDQNLYLSAVYFFLHFQYNGWFIFACLGIFFHLLKKHGIALKNEKLIFILLTASLAPAYFLSILWADFPDILYAIIVFAAAAQLYSWFVFLNDVKNQWKSLTDAFSKFTRTLIILSAMACTIKFFLQMGSTIPSLSHIAYGFRPIIIGYLHLVFLGITTLFLIAYLYHEKSLPNIRPVRNAIRLSAAGIILNEAFLMLQGLTYMNYILIPYSDRTLLIIAAFMFLGFGSMVMVTYYKERIVKGG